MTLGILYRDELTGYNFGEGHPFQGERYTLFYDFLKKTLPEDNNYTIIKAEEATDKDLQMICHKNFIEFTRGYYDAAYWGIAYPGKFNDFHSMDNLPTGKPGQIEVAARYVVGQAKLASHLVMEDTYKKVVSIGGGLHHAKPNYGEGFCIYNDVAFCAKYLLHEFKLDRILVLDTDAHFGNGTSEYFYDDPRVLYMDLHQDPLTIYPFAGFASEIGDGKGKGFNINIPMPITASDHSYKMAFEEIVEPVTREFKPQIIIRNGGSDPHFEDGLTNLGMTATGHEMLTRKVKEMSEICGGRVIDMIASGYNRTVLPACWMALIKGLGGFDIQIDEPVPVPEEVKRDAASFETGNVIAEVRGYHQEFWKSLR
jgi:acetoin utilization protein AcuC